jgi:16S rRNA (uracil1498-N3)-methyltransferase
MHRSYADISFATTDDIAIHEKDEVHHLKDVMRLKKGDRFCVFNGRGEEAECELDSISSQMVSARILDVRREPHTNRFSIALACAIPKKTKFEWILEKATELGADEIIPLKTERTEVKLLPDRSAKKDQRFQSIVLSAAKQSRRLWMPRLHPITEFKDVLTLIDPETSAFIPCLVDPRQPISACLNLNILRPKILVLIGPEGDFTPAEVQAAMEAGAIPISLGKTVLRVETAAISVLSAIQLTINA